jgi:polyisoprenoid-binding protein YceI
MNEHMLKALKAKEHPAIAFSLSAYDLVVADTGKSAVLRGTLRIGGVEKPVTLNVQLTAGSEGGLRVKGTHTVTMTEFGLKPPSLMLGTMKVRDQVVVGFDLLLDK